jgi:hypothetical protein
VLWRDLDRAPHPGQKVDCRLSTVTVKACSRRSTLTTFMPAAGDHVIDVFIAPCCRIPAQGASPPASSAEARHPASACTKSQSDPLDDSSLERSMYLEESNIGRRDFLQMTGARTVAASAGPTATQALASNQSADSEFSGGIVLQPGSAVAQT